jgi:hypothetical protein
MLLDAAKALHDLADAAERLTKVGALIVRVEDDGERRESILRNQNDGELDALARKLKSRLGL